MRSRRLPEAPVLALTLILTSSIVLVAATAPAQEDEDTVVDREEELILDDVPPAERTAGIEDIKVTGRKREELLQSVPISIRAFSQQELEARSITRVDQIGEATANLKFDSTLGSNQNSRIFIRGVGQANPSSLLDPGVGLYIDGVYLPRAQGGLLQLIDTERIEVLRGPQGTLFGKNTVGGVINIHTAKPGREFGWRVQAGAGDYGLYESSLMFDLPIRVGDLTDKVFTRFSFLGRRNQGYSKNRSDGGNASGRDNIWGGRFALLALPTDDVTIDFTFDISQQPQAQRMGKCKVSSPFSLGRLVTDNYTRFEESCAESEGADRLNGFLRPVSKDKVLIYGGMTAVDWAMTDEWSAKFIGSVRRRDSNGSTSDLDYADEQFLESNGKSDNLATSAELTFSGDLLEGRLSLVSGAYFFYEEGQSETQGLVLNQFLVDPVARSRTSPDPANGPLLQLLGGVPGVLPSDVDAGDGTGVTYSMFDYIVGALACNPNVGAVDGAGNPILAPNGTQYTTPDPTFEVDGANCGFAPSDPGANPGNIDTEQFFVGDILTPPSLPGTQSEARRPQSPYALTRGIEALNRETSTDWWNLSYAGYGQMSFDLTDEVEVTGGIRYTRERKYRKGKIRQVYPDFGNPVSPVSNQNKFNQRWTPMAQVGWSPMYEWYDDIRLDNSYLYFTYAKGWKSGGFNESVLTQEEAEEEFAEGLEEFVEFDPETSDAYEIGVKTQWFDRRVTFNVSAFLNLYDKIQVTALGVDRNGILSANITNAGKAKIQGFEIETSAFYDADWLPGENAQLIFSGGLGFTRANYDDFDTLQRVPGDPAVVNPDMCSSLRFISCVGPDGILGTPDDAGILGVGGIVGELTNPTVVPGDSSGKNFTNTPKWNFNLSTTYSFDVPWELGTLSTRLDYAWQDKVYYTVQNDVDEGPFGLFGGRIWLTKEELFGTQLRGTFALWMRNILDRRYSEGGLDLGETVGIDVEFYGRPRTFGGEFTIEY